MGKLKMDSPIYCIKDNWENCDNERSSMHKAEYDLNAIMYPYVPCLWYIIYYALLQEI